MRTPRRSKVLNPWTLALIEYVDGSTAGNEYSPEAFEIVSREVPLASLVNVMVTPGITPCASRTAPRTPPVED
jgi:hypothetical protein